MVQRPAPERTCIACRETKPKRALVRVVRTVSGNVQLDPSGKHAGRGAYLCSEYTCWQKGLRKDALARALKTTLTEADRGALECYAESLIGEPSNTARSSTGGRAE